MSPDYHLYVLVPGSYHGIQGPEIPCVVVHVNPEGEQKRERGRERGGGIHNATLSVGRLQETIGEGEEEREREE